MNFLGAGNVSAKMFYELNCIGCFAIGFKIRLMWTLSVINVYCVAVWKFGGVSGGI